MKAEEFDKKFDEGEDVSDILDMSAARRPAHERKCLSLHFPLWMIQLGDKDAKRLGIPRRHIIRLWIAERLQKAS